MGVRARSREMNLKPDLHPLRIAEEIWSGVQSASSTVLTIAMVGVPGRPKLG